MIKHIFHWKVILAGLIIGLLMLSVSVAVNFIGNSGAIVSPASDAPIVALTIISAPTGTPRTLPPTPTSLPPTPTQPPTTDPSGFVIGAYVQVTIGEDALRIRPEPGLGSDPLFLAFDAEVFLIKDGPRLVDGYTWWYLTASYDLARSGWAAQDFLTVIPSP